MDAAAVITALRQLPEKDRECLQLTYWENLTAVEVGTVLRTTEKSIWKRLDRAKAALVDALPHTTASDQAYSNAFFSEQLRAADPRQDSSSPDEMVRNEANMAALSMVELSRLEPSVSEPDLELDRRALADLHKITATRSAANSPFRRWLRPRFLVPALALLLVAAIAVAQPWNLLNPVQTSLTTPVMLAVDKTSEKTTDAVSDFVSKLDAAAAETIPQRAALFEGWFIQVKRDGSAGSAPIIPETTSISWAPDLSGTITVTAKGARAPDGSPLSPAPRANSPQAGTVLRSEAYPPGTMPVSFRDTPPSTPESMRVYLTDNDTIKDENDPTAYVDAAVALLGEWTLTPSQHSSILRLLETFEGFSLAGDVTDRAGRQGTAFRVTSPTDSHYDRLVILGASSGRIIEVDTIYTGGIAELDIAAPAVVNYVMWLDQKR